MAIFWTFEHLYSKLKISTHLMKIVMDHINLNIKNNSTSNTKPKRCTM